VSAGRTVTLSVHRLRAAARRRERAVQALLETGHTRTALDGETCRRLAQNPWIRGARVEKAGRFQWTVVGTEGRGR
jgi:hypothetical protein